MADLSCQAKVCRELAAGYGTEVSDAVGECVSCYPKDLQKAAVAELLASDGQAAYRPETVHRDQAADGPETVHRSSEHPEAVSHGAALRGHRTAGGVELLCEATQRTTLLGESEQGSEKICRLLCQTEYICQQLQLSDEFHRHLQQIAENLPNILQQYEESDLWLQQQLDEAHRKLKEEFDSHLGKIQQLNRLRTNLYENKACLLTKLISHDHRYLPVPDTTEASRANEHLQTCRSAAYHVGGLSTVPAVSSAGAAADFAKAAAVAVSSSTFGASQSLLSSAVARMPVDGKDRETGLDTSRDFSKDQSLQCSIRIDWDAVSEKECYKALRGAHASLTDKLDCRQVKDILFSKDVLAEEDMDQIESGRCLRDARSYLLHTVRRRKGKHGFKLFAMALLETNQEYLYDILTKDLKKDYSLRSISKPVEVSPGDHEGGGVEGTIGLPSACVQGSNVTAQHKTSPGDPEMASARFAGHHRQSQPMPKAVGKRLKFKLGEPEQPRLCADLPNSTPSTDGYGRTKHSRESCLSALPRQQHSFRTKPAVPAPLLSRPAGTPTQRLPPAETGPTKPRWR